MSGISWGGYLTWLIAAYEPMLKAITPVYGCAIFGEHSHFRRQGYAPEVLDFWVNNWEPLSLSEKQTAAVAFLSGTNDFFGNLREADQLLSRLKVPHRSSYLTHADHSIGSGESALASNWMHHYLQGGPPLPESPQLLPDGQVKADTTQPVQKEEICWTNSDTLPRFACWHQGPLPNSFSMAFVRVTYEAGFSLCSPIIYGKPSGKIHLSDTWPDLRNGTGWRWELGSTQLYENKVRINPLQGGHRLEVIPQEKTSDHPVAVLLHQIQDPGWKLKGHDCLLLGWEQAGRSPILKAHFLRYGKGFPETTAICAQDGSTYRIELPEELRWEEVVQLRISAEPPRPSRFILGPLCKSVSR
jgi:hypothetical protein